ncbi:MAG TPA: polysaccharide deacetylase family protein [Symbiobacteriaceae bacterium]|nr:polysaccharide deacetylase family protein [Symbiobacteriaceae bacterium]
MLHVKLPPTFPAERQYICAVVLGDFLGQDYRVEVMERNDVSISRDDGRELRLADVFFQTPGSFWLKPESLPARPLVRWSVPGTVVQPTLPVLYGRQYYEVYPDHISLGLDIFGSIFFLLTRYEEAVKPDRDSRDRFPAAASLAVLESFLDRPLADEYVEVLWRALQTLWPGLERPRRESRVLLSHDVETPSSSLGRNYAHLALTTAGDLVRRGSPVLAVRRLAGSVKAYNGKPEADICNTFDLLMDAAERRGWRSCFNFITDHTAGQLDGTYAIGHPWIRSLLRRIHERGHEIGLHTSYQTYKDPAQIAREYDRLLAVADRERIRQDRWGGRQNYLRFEAPTTWAAWDAAGLDYDSTLGYPDQPGFRCGTCHEYPVFDLRSRRPLKLRERPLIVMERAPLDAMRLIPEEALQLIRRLRYRCKLVDGDFTLLWHNDRLADRKERDFFLRLVADL